MKNTWGDPLTDALQADKAEARQAAREMLKRLLLFAAEAQVDPEALRSVWEKKHSWLKEQR
jgi:hypothetical protein